MSELSEQFKGKRNWLQKVVEFIPGFKGYFDKNRRREADKVLRDFVLSKFQGERTRLQNLQEDYTNEGNLEAIGKIDNLVRYLEKVIDKIRFSDRGYAGFFAEIKIKEAELEKLYQYDYSMLENVQELSVLVDGLSAEYSKENIKSIDESLKAVDRKIDDRKNLFINISGTQ